MSEIRSQPGEFPDPDTITRRSGFSAVRLRDLFRQHYHSTPMDVLLRARVESSKRQLLSGGNSCAEIASTVGFESVSVYEQAFLRLNGMTPQACRDLRSARSFEIKLPAGYPLNYLRRALGRDRESVTERLEEGVYRAGIRIVREPYLLRLGLSPSRISVSVSPGASSLAPVRAMVTGLLGLDQDAAAFSRLAKGIGLDRLVAHCPELRVHQTHSVFDGLLWAIIGQQINLAFAYKLRRRLMELAGTPMEYGLVAPPTPEKVASLQTSELLALQYSRQKADYIISTARLIAEGKLTPDALRSMSATRAERTLLAVRGLGVWSVNYLMMRSLNFGDCLPLGDTGVTSGLQSLLDLKHRPDAATTRRLTAQFNPYRSLATAHLWQFEKPIPE